MQARLQTHASVVPLLRARNIRSQEHPMPVSLWRGNTHTRSKDDPVRSIVPTSLNIYESMSTFVRKHSQPV
jgi:hypothetical protein